MGDAFVAYLTVTFQLDLSPLIVPAKTSIEECAVPFCF